MSSNQDKDKGKSKGKSVLDGTSSTFKLPADVFQDLQNPETGGNTPKKPSSHTPKTGTGQNGRNSRESVGTKAARDRAIKAFDGIDELLPMLEAAQARDMEGKHRAGSGGELPFQRGSKGSSSRGPGQQTTLSPGSRAGPPPPDGTSKRAGPPHPRKVKDKSPMKQTPRSANAIAGPSNLRRPAGNPGSRSRPGPSTRPPQDAAARDKARHPLPRPGNAASGEKTINNNSNKGGNGGGPDGSPAQGGPRGPRGPFDLPTEHYAAIITQPDFPYYLDYPARIHHLKYPTASARSSPNSSWEDIHLHQKVSLPRMHTHWVRDITEADRMRMRDSFFRFSAAAAAPHSGNSSGGGGGGEPIMGFRAYRDTLFLDASYIKAAFRAAHQQARNTLAPHSRFDTAKHIAPFLPSQTDRAKIHTLAVAASAFTDANDNDNDNATTATTNSITTATDSLCEALAAAFPSLQRILLVSLAVIDRPPGARWDLETAFAQWLRFSDAMQLEAKQTTGMRNGPVATFGHKRGFVGNTRAARERAGAGGRGTAAEKPTLVAAVEAAWARARARARVEATQRWATTSHAHQYGDDPAGPGLGSESESESVSSTGAVVAGGDADESMRQDLPSELMAEPYVMLYYRDAYDRAVAKGWKHDALLPLDNLDLELE